MKWYFAVSAVSVDHRDHDFHALIRTAVNSALANTSLVPHMLYDGPENDFTRDMRGLGVHVILHRISFHDRVKAAQERQRPDWTSYMFVASGALLRFEIPLIEYEDDFVLYTDCDVVFLRDLNVAGFRPAVFAVAPQMDCTSDADMNSGVMVMNVPRLRADLPPLIDFLCEHFAEIDGFDQETYRLFYAEQWNSLPAEYNWKPYWGINPGAALLHFHGPKPPAVRKLMADADYEVPDAWRKLFFANPESYRYYLALWDRYQVSHF
jgi:lipopolysaccharide biosynthesis glycosyltransferase